MLPAAVLALSACSGGEATESASGPCDLLTEQDALALLDVDDVVRALPVNELLDKAPIPSDRTLSKGQRAVAKEEFSQTCAYAPLGEVGFTLAAVQVDQGLFRSADEFEESWPERAEILKAPGLAAALVQDPEKSGAFLYVLVNEQGDSLALVVTGVDVDRAALLELGEEAVSRY